MNIIKIRKKMDDVDRMLDNDYVDMVGLLALEVVFMVVTVVCTICLTKFTDSPEWLLSVFLVAVLVVWVYVCVVFTRRIGRRGRNRRN